MNVVRTKLSRTAIQGPSDPKHVWVGLLGRQMVHFEVLQYLKENHTSTGKVRSLREKASFQCSLK